MQDNEYRQQRIENMNQLTEAGFPAYGKAFDRTDTLEKLHADFEEGRQVKACGRIVAMRKMGKKGLMRGGLSGLMPPGSMGGGGMGGGGMGGGGMGGGFGDPR